MQDNVKARIMQPDGKYVRAERGYIAIDAQSRFYAEAYANAPKPAPVNDSKAVEPEKEKKGFLGWLKRLFRRKKKYIQCGHILYGCIFLYKKKDRLSPVP